MEREKQEEQRERKEGRRGFGKRATHSCLVRDETTVAILSQRWGEF